MHLVVDYGGVVVHHDDPHEQAAQILGVDPETEMRRVALPYFAYQRGFLQSTAEYLDLLETVTGASPAACREYLDERWLDPELPDVHADVLRDLAADHTLLLFGNAVQPWVETVLTDHGVREWFDELVVSSAIQRAKPHPRGYVACLSEADTDRPVAMISDEYDEDLLMAETVGMRSVWVERDGVEPFREPDYRVDGLAGFPAVVAEMTE
ncbi:HAD family hydrolase [Halobaculum sp. MBLA0147]|uniref:HAD family hydrolase n=1 Tax=Halobaculum sp. MBLA0147 TaxID=3079934 RepID=UPI00352342B6